MRPACQAPSKGFSEAIERERAVIEQQAIALANRGDELPEE